MNGLTDFQAEVARLWTVPAAGVRGGKMASIRHEISILLDSPRRAADSAKMTPIALGQSWPDEQRGPRRIWVRVLGPAE